MRRVGHPGAGLFADGRYGDGWNGVPGKVRGLFYGDRRQLVAKCIGIVACVAWAGTMTYLALRVHRRAGRQPGAAGRRDGGLDVPEMGIEGYAMEPSRN